jgi:hypothetical protein
MQFVVMIMDHVLNMSVIDKLFSQAYKQTTNSVV